MSDFLFFLSKKEIKDDRKILEAFNAINFTNKTVISKYTQENLVFGQGVNNSFNNNQQDLFFKNEKYIVLTDSMIFNKSELQKEFQICENLQDSEFIYKLYLKLGNKICSVLEGPFSFLIYDREKNNCFVSRDIFGQRSIYYSIDNDKIAVSSSVSAIRKLLELNELDEEKIAEYIVDFCSSDNKTFFKKIKKVEPSHFLNLNFNKEKHVKYFCWRVFFENLNPSNFNEKYFLNNFKKTVNSMAETSKNKYGSTLSGGIDSASISAILATKSQKKELNTFNVEFFGLPQDKLKETKEENYIQDFLRKYSVNHTKIKLNYKSDGPYRNLQFNKYLDEPLGIINGYMHKEIYADCERKQVNFLFDGLFGDEVISHGIFKLTELAKEKKYVDLLFEINHLKSKGLISTRRSQIKSLILNPILININNFFSKEKKDPYAYRINDWSKFINSKYRDVIGNNREKLEFRSDVKQQLLFLESRMIEFSLEQLNMLSRQHNVKAIYPFLDRRIIEECLKVPSKLKLKKGITRYYFKNSLKDLLPESIYRRNSKANIGAFAKNQTIEFMKNFELKETMPIAKFINIKLLSAEIKKNLSEKSNNQGFFVFIFNLVMLNEWIEYTLDSNQHTSSH